MPPQQLGRMLERAPFVAREARALTFAAIWSLPVWLGIAAHETLVAGDGANDIAMIQAAGTLPIFLLAIPAVFGYNLFASRLNRIDGELSSTQSGNGSGAVDGPDEDAFFDINAGE